MFVPGFGRRGENDTGATRHQKCWKTGKVIMIFSRVHSSAENRDPNLNRLIGLF